MVSRKRTRAESEEIPLAEPPQHQNGLLHQLRNMWEFANLMQYIYTFGKVVKISEDIEIDDLETECLKPGPSEVLLDIGLSLLKFVSSHRGITAENFEEFARRQYYAKAPARNPFGDDEQPIKFHDLDVFERIRVLQQLSAWTFWNPDRIRERMPEQKETEQTQWRIEELGYDRHDRLYYVLDDNRLYRRTDPPIPPPKPAKPKANSKRARALARAARKRKLAESNGIKEEDQGPKDKGTEDDSAQDPSQDYKWECIAVTLAEYQAFVKSLEKTKDPNEKILRDRLVKDVLPVIQQSEEAQQKKIQRREKELITLQKLANAKRSSRLAEKQERERRAREAAEEERRREAERIAELKKQEEQERIEKERLYRLMTREQRLKDREERRRKHEEELAAIAEQAEKAKNGDARLSERQLKAEMAKREQDLAALQAEEDHWFFDCSGCGVHGENLDDGTHSVACEKCNVWQHSRCLGILKEEAEKDDFHFICKDCQRRIEEANRPKLPPLKFRIPKATTPPSESSGNVNGEQRKHESHHEQSANKAKTSPTTSPTKSKPPQMANGTAISGVQHVPPGQPPPMSAPTNGSLSSLSQPRPMDNVSTFQSPSKQPVTSSNLSIPPLNQAIGSMRPDQPNPPLRAIQHYPPAAVAGMSSARGSFSSHRPTSSNFMQSPFPSPIQNRPSISPTQGNRDVGPLAGFPPSSQPNRTAPSTPFGSQSQSDLNSGSPYPVGPPNQSPSLSFSSTATPQANNSFSHTPPQNRYSPGTTMSGLSPTKHSPPQPPPFGDIGNTSVLPPVQQLQPSPKLMGRASPDAPIPPPVKSMTPEQEDRRRKENELAAQQVASQQQQQSQQATLSQNIPPLVSTEPRRQ
ncbi:hypothetical protein VTO42DRAFT_1385 [Malbranchea cinnamomea]